MSERSFLSKKKKKKNSRSFIVCARRMTHNSLHNVFFNTIKCYISIPLFWSYFKQDIAPNNNNNHNKKRARLYFNVIHLFIHSFFQILSNIFLRTTAFNTWKHLKFFTLKTFFSPSPPSIPFQNKWSKHSFQHRLGTTSPTRDPCVERIQESWLFDWTCVLGAGWDISQTITDCTSYYKGESRGEQLSVSSPLPGATYMCNHVNIVKTLQQQRKCVLPTCGLCGFRLVATSNSCLCEWQTLGIWHSRAADTHCLRATLTICKYLVEICT